MNVKTKPLSPVEAKNRDIVEYLSSLGFEPARISRQHYWYLSPFCSERTASFKVNRDLNRWYDFGQGRGGNLIDFGVLYFKCTVSEFLHRLPVTSSPEFSYLKSEERLQSKTETTQVLKVKNIDSPALLCYLKKRKIDRDVARRWCKEITFTIYQKRYYAIGFVNDAGGYELRNEFFKASSRPKDITTIKSNEEQLSVFEGFFDFLSYQTICKGSEHTSHNFLILNSLSFIVKIESLLTRYKEVNLFLDQDGSGQKATLHLLSSGNHISDKSALYQKGKDLNDWLTCFGLRDDNTYKTFTPFIRKLMKEERR